MADETRRTSGFSPFPAIAVSLLAAGIATKNVSLESIRPTVTDSRKIVRLAKQDLEARLWQDPFATVDGEIARLAREAGKAGAHDRVPRLAEARDTIRNSDRAHQLDAFINRLNLEVGIGGDMPAISGKLRLLIVPLYGGGFEEDAEFRRRTRYAVVSGLYSNRFLPVDAAHIGYVWTRHGAPAGTQPDPTRPNDPPAWPDYVSYEWFVRTTANPENPGAGADRMAAGTHSPDEKVLVVWVEDEFLGSHPLMRISRLVRALACDLRSDPQPAPPCPALAGFVDLFLIGPAGTASFLAMFDEKKHSGLRAPHGAGRGARQYRVSPGESAGWEYPEHLLPMTVISPFATPPEKPSFRFDEPGWEKIRLLRVIGGDDLLAKALVQELELRNVFGPTGTGRTCRPWKQGGPRPAILVVSEADADSAGNATLPLVELLNRQCESVSKGQRPSVLRMNFLRGLDGVAGESQTLPVNGASAGGDRHAMPRSVDDLLRDATAKVRSQGRSQLDYLHRLANASVRAAEDGTTPLDVRAVGVFGSDVYDKLLVLQALRDRFPRALFFTTDLDARFMDARNTQWTRNLVVASHFGLELHQQLQAGVPPFRDGYQTAAFLAMQVALGPGAANTTQEKIDGWSRAAVPDSCANGSSWSLHHWAARLLRTDRCDIDHAGRRVFEIGRNRAVELHRAGTTAACDLREGCSSLHPIPSQRYPDWHPGLPQGLALAALVILALLTVPAWPALQQSFRERSLHTRRSPLFGLACGLIVTLALAWLISGLIAHEAEQGHGEPFLLNEGVSRWPAQCLRVIAILACAYLIHQCWKAVESLRREVGQRVARLRGTEKASAAGPSCSGMTPQSSPAGQGLAAWLRTRQWSLALRWTRGPLLPYGTDSGRTMGMGAVALGERWNELQCRLRFRSADHLVWLLIAGFTVIVLGYGIDAGRGDRFSPHRGVLSGLADVVLEPLVVLAATGLVLTVIFITRTVHGFIDELGPGENDSGTGDEQSFYLYWEQFKVVVHMTRLVHHIILFPFAILILALLIRSSVFDAGYWPLSLKIMAALALGYALAGAWHLRRSAEAMRARTRHHYLSIVDGLPAAHAAKTPFDDKWREKAGAILARIDAERRGAFSPLSEQPGVNALLLPLGGFGGISVFEYLALIDW